MSSLAWTSLEAPYTNNTNNLHVRLAVPRGIDKNNYIVIDVEFKRRNLRIKERLFKNIFKYDTVTNKWTKIKLFDTECKLGQCALDTKNQILYTKSGNSLTSISLDSHSKGNKTKYKTSDTTIYSDIFFLGNSLFCMGGVTNQLIFQWNSEYKSFTEISKMYNNARLDSFGLVYLKKKHCLMLFGGYDYNTEQMQGDILEFEFKTKTWNKLLISLPMPDTLGDICCITVINERYVLIFGGEHLWGEFNDNIYIYSVEEKILRKSKIKCPSKSVFRAITVNDKMRDEKSVFGFVRKYWEICQINECYFPPYYLLRLIHTFYLVEQVYLLDIRANKHYKMSSLEIV
eukprot:66581_1